MPRLMLTTATIMLGLAAAVPCWPDGAAQSVPITADAREVTRLRGEAARARERAAALDRQASAALRASDRATLATAALAARVQQAEAALASAETDLALVSGERGALDARLARERAPVARLLAGLQLQARRPPLLELLQPGSVEDAVHLRAVLAAVTPQIGERTTGLRAEIERARGLEQDAMRTAAQRRALQKDLLTRRNELATRSESERIKARRAAGSADREAERAFAIGEDARNLSTLIARLQTSSDSRFTAPAGQPQDAAAPAPARFRLPVAGPLDAGSDSPSKGVAVIPRPGALVVAPGNGRVAFAGPYRGYGAIVIIEHPGGWTSLVTGLAATQVAVGQMLVAGSPLGQASTRDPRILFELRRNGQAINPLDQLRSAGDRR